MRRRGHETVTDARTRWLEYWPLAVLVLAAIAISVVVQHEVFPAYSWNRDEPVYLWQVQALREGKVFTSGGGTPLFFQPWLSGISDGMFFSQYTLGWPLVLLIGDVALGSASSALAFSTALAVLGTYAFAREITRDRWIALVASGVLVLSPVLVIQSGMYLGYLFSLGLGGLFGASLLAGLRTGKWWLLVVSGLLVGWLFMTRPFDGFLWGVAIVAYATFASWREKPALARALIWVALGFLPLLVATLAYNRHVTGSFTEFPITAADPRDTFGFGIRSIGRRWEPTDFTPLLAVKGVGRNAWELPPFLFGSYVAVALAAVGLWIRRRDRRTLALLAIAAAFPIGYFFFWGISLSANFAKVSGPIYFIPLLLPLSIFIASTLVVAWKCRRAVAIAAAVVLVAATAPFMVDRIDKNQAISEAQVPWQEATARFDGRSLVFVERSGPYLLHLNPFSENTPDLDGRILYAADRGPENLDLIARRPGRRVYYERTNLTTEQTLADFDLPVPRIAVTPMTVERGEAVALRVRITNQGDDPVVVASLRVGAQVEQRVLSTNAAEGDSFETEWLVSAPAGASASGAVALPARLGTVFIEAGAGSDPTTAFDARHEQLRFSYRLDGDEVELLTPGRSYRLRESRGALRSRRSSASEWIDVAVNPRP